MQQQQPQPQPKHGVGAGDFGSATRGQGRKKKYRKCAGVNLLRPFALVTYGRQVGKYEKNIRLFATGVCFASSTHIDEQTNK
jgi:hypothetical protein